MISPNSWVGIVPHWATGISGLSALTVVHINSWFEIITALMLGIGLYTRWVALILSIHLLVIASGFGASATGIRDFGLALSMFALSLFGTHKYCVDCKVEN
jgi:uncharacterized membrane protein YphA (DoxX/SURF4 family)